MKIDKQKLYKLYMQEINRICDLCEDKSSFSPKEIVGIIAEIIEKNPNLYKIENQVQVKKFRI